MLKRIIAVLVICALSFSCVYAIDFELLPKETGTVIFSAGGWNTKYIFGVSGNADYSVTRSGNIKKYQLKTYAAGDVLSVQLLKDLKECENKYAAGDMCVLKVRFRVVSADTDDGKGSLYMGVQNKQWGGKYIWTEQNADSEWRTVYSPYEAERASDEDTIILAAGQAKQSVEIAEVSLISYGKTLKFGDIYADYDSTKPSTYRNRPIIGKRAAEIYKGSPVEQIIAYGANGKYAAEVTFGNAADNDGNADIYFAEYDGSGKLVSVVQKTVNAADKTGVEPLRKDIGSGGHTVKAFALNHGSIAPLCDFAEIADNSRQKVKRTLPVSDLTADSDMNNLYFSNYRQPNTDESFMAGTYIYDNPGWKTWVNRRNFLPAEPVYTTPFVDGSYVFRADIKALDGSNDPTRTQLYLDLPYFNNKYQKGDKCLIKLTFNTISGGDASGNGRLGIVLENKANGTKRLTKEITADKEWHTMYIPFEAQDTSDNEWLLINLAYYVQKIQIKELKVINYGSDVKLSELPCSENELIHRYIYHSGNTWSSSYKLFGNTYRNAKVTQTTYTDTSDNMKVFRANVTYAGDAYDAGNVKYIRTLKYLPETVTAGDKCLLKITFRATGADHESGQGKIGIAVEKTDTGAKMVYSAFSAGSDWVTAYMPFTATYGSDESQIILNLGYYTQCIEIKELNLMDFEAAVSLDRLPQSDSRVSLIKECTDPNAEWRKEALERIEKIRKGDFKINVIDSDGKPVSNAEISLNMTEHDFEWGTAINAYGVNGSGDAADKYREILGNYFNAAVIEGLMQWNSFDYENDTAHKTIELARELGLKNMRGHTLLVDQKNSVSTEAAAAFESGDSNALNKILEEHFRNECLEFYGDVNEWDVMNEATYRNMIRSKYGIDEVKLWYEWARKYSHPETKLYFNETQLDENVFSLLDEMTANNVDFDGIGIECHRGFAPIEDFYNKLERAANYGKRLKITEYDLDMSNTVLQGESTRDFLIACFSCEAVDGIYLWGFTDAIHWLTEKGSSAAILLDKDYNLKYSGEQYTDLVYNKWLTREKGTTDAGGGFTCRGFYGDYDITVKSGNIVKTVSASFPKGGNREVTVTLPAKEFTAVKKIDFEEKSGWVIYSGTNGPIYENGTRVGYTSSSTGYGGSGKTNGNNTFLKQDVKAGAVSGVNLHGQMKLEAGKRYKLSCRMAASGEAQPGEVKVVVGRTFLDTWFDSGISRYTDYAEEDLIMSDSITDDENWRYYETEFTAMEGTTGKSAVVIGVFNKSAANVQYGIDDIEIYEERAKTEQE